MAKNAATKVFSALGQLRSAIDALKSDVLVGVPKAETARKGEDTGAAMNNATIAFIQDQGSELAHIPARPFMKPGVEANQERITKALATGARAGLARNPAAFDRALHIAGLLAQAGIRGKINAGIPPPLRDRTLAARRRRGRTGTVPLIDTGQLRNSINYVVRNRK